MSDVHHFDPNASPRGGSTTELDAFFALASVWALGAEQQIVLLGSPSRSTYFKWKRDGGSVSTDTEERISHLMAIYKALQILFPDPDRADAWLRRPNRVFEGRTALDVMLGGRLQDIIRVREYIDAQRGG
jgi:uncharacterized protein (DUF2384 family)